MTSPTSSRPPLNRLRWHMLALVWLIALAPAARAQDGDRDPPSRAARVVNVVGDAWLFDHENHEWMRLVRNQTVGEGDRVRTDDRGRVSLRVGSTSIWVDERSDLELSQLDEGQTQLLVDRGDVAVRLRSVENAMETRLRTREGTVQPEREGVYRVEQLDAGTKVYVWQGRMRFSWARGADPVWVGTGEQVELWWPESPRAERGPLYSDAFSDWVLAESRDEGDRPVARYVSPEMTGAEDLDRYGRWETAPDYGTVWIPTTVAVADWAPYRYGHWAWSRHWGWTWVDDAPWGFAPFHYGRWVSWGGRWCWAPGPYVHRPVYAPALVGWVGGPSVSVNISIGSRPAPPSYGWYPLAPREVFVPAYRHSPRYEGRVNDPRDLRDPVTVQRPNRYRDVPSAVSLLPSPGAAIQSMPVRGPDRKAEPGWARPLPTAPGRGDLAAVLPAAPTRPAEGERPRERDREAGQGWRGDALPQRRDTWPAAPAPTRPGAPATAQPVAPVPMQPQPAPAVQARPSGDGMPWRAQQQRDDMQRRDEAQAQQRQQQQQIQIQQQQQQQMQQQRQQQQLQEQQRRDEMLQRQQQEQRRDELQQLQQRREEQQRRDEMMRRAPQVEPQRMPEPMRVQTPPPQPQPQAQQRAAQPRDEGPQRGRQDGRHDDRRGEPQKQVER